MRSERRLLAKWSVRTIIFIAVINLLFDFSSAIYPLIDSHGTVLDGEHRGIAIGSSRGYVAHMTTSSDTSGRLKLVAYKNRQNSDFRDVSVPSEALTASEWVLAYPGFPKETIWVEFDEDGVVTSIKYQRVPFDP